MNFVLSRNKISNAVILCGGHNARLGPLIRRSPVCMLPVLNRPFIECTIDFLKDNGIKNIIVSVSDEHENRRGDDYLSGLRHNYGRGLDIRCIGENRPRGTAGALRDLKDFIGDECFLVINGNTFVEDMDIDEMMTGHHTKSSSVTIGVKKTERFATEGIRLNEDGTVKDFFTIHSSRERRFSYIHAGIYIFDPIALQFINESGYFDIKEQLIPALNSASLAVRIHEIEGYCRTVNSIEDYYEIHRTHLSGGFSMNGDMTEVAEGVWVGYNTSISPQAYVVGPAIIGNNCRIAANTQIIGPTVIGDNCRIEERAKIRESILWSGVRVGEGSNMNYCIAGYGITIPSGDSCDNKVLIDDMRHGDVNLIPSQHKIDRVVEPGVLQISSFRYFVYLGIKRLMDVLASSALLIFLSPLIFLTAIAIKMDSEGQVIFRQKRCGKNGKDFQMLKFRTMVKDAHSLQQKLASQNNVDGPMFKLVDDPRVTKIGKILRKTSLDELPQLINVLKGEMSLVGPRPLVMDEMKFSPSWRSIRLKVKPGITGLWQVQGRSEAPFHEWIRHDVYYVKNQSLWLDIKILLKTIKVVFKKAGAY
ncbi:MAG: sugar transferase [Deltaproteobacteria bacterium]|nr:sugar transferase [Deltaproteobacteria bacterium]